MKTFGSRGPGSTLEFAAFLGWHNAPDNLKIVNDKLPDNLSDLRRAAQKTTTLLACNS